MIMIANMNRVTRRQSLRLGAAALLSAGLWPGALAAKEGADEDDFTFIVVNDLHYFDENCAPFFHRAFKQMRETEGSPEFCLVVGDLAENGRLDQLGAMKELLQELKMDTHIVVGNHDYAHDSDRAAYEQLYPKTINYAFEHRGWQFIGLDTTEGVKGSNTLIQKPTFDWLRDNLPKLDKNKRTIVFTHFPLGWLLPSVPRNANAFLDTFKEFNLKHVFSGHFHSTTVRSWGSTGLTTNKCCSFHHANHDGTKEKGYFVCRVKDGKLAMRDFAEVKMSV